MAALGVSNKCEPFHYHGDGNFSMCQYVEFGISNHRIGGGYKCSNGYFHQWGLDRPHLAAVVAGAWVVFVILMGLIQSIVRFRKLMLGKRVRRGFPTLFTCVVPILSVLAFSFWTSGYAARVKSEQTALKKQWDDMSIWRKFRLWLRYGFTKGYPPMLGQAPPRIGWSHIEQPASTGVASVRDTQEEEGVLAPPPYSRPPSPLPLQPMPSSSASSSEIAIIPAPSSLAEEEPPQYGKQG
jgi:hypothetical protein